MGIHFEYNAEHNFMLAILCGSVSNEEFSSLIDQLLSDEYTIQGMRGLSVICKNISGKEISWKTLFDGGKRMHGAKFRQGGKHAIMAGGSLAYGLARIYQTATEALEMDETRVLHMEQISEAMQWLGIEPLEAHITGLIRQCEAASSSQQVNDERS